MNTEHTFIFKFAMMPRKPCALSKFRDQMDVSKTQVSTASQPLGARNGRSSLLRNRR